MKTITIATALMILLVCSATAVLGMEFVKYSLPNGMEFLLGESHSAGMIAFLVTIDAGSYLETPGQGGVSHMLEHLLFDGTLSRSRNELSRQMMNIGGYFNAFTRKDYTAFFFIVPSDQFEEGLEIQSDMLFNSLFPEEEVEKERKVVIEEINKDDSNPDYRRDGFADEVFFSGTPYAKRVLGRRSIIATITREEIMEYYRKHYAPRNMRALVVGDFSVGEVKGLLNRYFGGRDDGIQARTSGNYGISRDGKIQKTYMDVDQCYVNINLPAPSLGSSDYYAFKYLCDLLNNPGSWIKRELEKAEGLGIVSTEISYEHHRGFSSAVLKIQAQSSDVEKIVEVALSAVRGAAGRKLEEGLLEEAKISHLTDEIYNEEKFHYYGMMKAEGLALGGSDFILERMAGFKAVKKKEVEKVARKYLSDPAYSIAAVLPESRSEGSGGRIGESTYDAWRAGNGMSFITKYNQDSRVFALHLLFKNRLACEPSGKEGITEVLSRMLLKGTKARNEAKLDRALKRIGARLEVTDNPYIPYDDYRTKADYSFIRFQTVDDYYEEGIELLREIVFEPAFPEGELAKVKSEIKSLIDKRDNTPYKLARKLFYKTLFAGHPFQFDVLGEKESIESITVGDLKEFHRRYFSPSNMIVTVVSNVPGDRLRKELESTFGVISGDDEPCFIPGVRAARRVLEIKKRIEASQNSIYLGNLLPAVSKEDVAPLTILSGLLSKKLGEELREKQGLAYRVGSSIYFGCGYTVFWVHMGTAKGNLQVAKEKLQRSLEELLTGISPEDLQSFKNGYRGRMLMRRLSRINQAYYMGINEHRGFGFDFDEEFQQMVKETTIEDLKRIVRKYMSSNNYVIAIAGPMD